MIKEHNYDSGSINIELCNNGYIISTGYPLKCPEEKCVHKTFTEAVNQLATMCGLIGVGDKLELKFIADEVGPQ